MRVSRASPYSYAAAPRLAPARKISASFEETESLSRVAPKAPA